CSSSRTALGGRDILLWPCLVLGSLNRRPALVCSRERSMRMLLASTSDQRRAKSSPIRHPVARPSDMSGYSLCSFRASLAALNLESFAHLTVEVHESVGVDHQAWTAGLARSM